MAIAPPNIPTSNAPGTLKADDIVVSDIGNNDAGTTLVRFTAKGGPSYLFNTVAIPGAKGPSAEAFNTRSGNEWVANVSGKNVQVFKPNGNVLLTTTNPLFNKPWGLGFNHATPNPKEGSIAAFLATNVADATIDRIAIIPSHGAPSSRVYQIGQLAESGPETKIAVTWIPSLQLHGKMYSDVFLATDPVTNRIAAFANSSTSNTTPIRSAQKGITIFQGPPLATPAGLTINPLDGDLLVTNQDTNDLVELKPSQGEWWQLVPSIMSLSIR